MSIQENLEFVELFASALPTIDLPTAIQVRNSLIAKIKELEQSIIDERVKFRETVLAKASELGLTPRDIFQTATKEKTPPKYQDPLTGKTWTGKGKKPRWVVAALESGKSLDDLLIPAISVDPEVGF